MANVPYPYNAPGLSPNPYGVGPGLPSPRYQVVKHPSAPKRLPYAIKDNATGGYVTGGSPLFARVFPTQAEALEAFPSNETLPRSPGAPARPRAQWDAWRQPASAPDATNGWGNAYQQTVHLRNVSSNNLAHFRQKYPGHADDPTLVALINKYDARIEYMNAHRRAVASPAHRNAMLRPAPTAPHDPTNGWGETYTRTVHDRNIYSNALAAFRLNPNNKGRPDDPNLVVHIRLYDSKIAHMNSVRPGRQLQANIAAAGGVPNRRPHGKITKATPDRFYGGLANAAGGVANLAGDIGDLLFGLPANAFNNAISPGSGKLKFNTEPYYGYDGPPTFRGQMRDLPRALSTAGTDLYNHPIGTLLEQLQYLDPNMGGAGAAEAWGDVGAARLPAAADETRTLAPDLRPAEAKGTYVSDSGVSVAPGASSPVPESYMNQNLGIDMRSAPPNSPVNKHGYPRNSKWFWEQMYPSNLDMFSPENVEKITADPPRSPIVDDQWIKWNPSHESFKGDILHHHHVDQGHMAVPLPKSIHYGWFGALHPDL